jgi:pimeloyl-ACP methyl ester carboxylesterase
MRRFAVLAAAVLPFAALLVFAAPANATVTGCGAISAPEVPGAEVLSTTAVERYDHVVPPGPLTPEPITDIPPFCEVVVTLTHPGAGDEVRIEVWLPLTAWNGRFQGTGGGGYLAGIFGGMLAPEVKRGYAAAATDAGVSMDPWNPGAWAGDEALLTNFASRSLHDLAVAGKAITAQHYGRPAAHNYWNGCSTGGRQGLMTAQRHPGDYDGILAQAPAINWTKFIVAEQWPQVVMHEEGTYPTQCELEAFNQAAVSACDTIDKVRDGMIASPGLCHYDPYHLVGTTILCEGEQVTITRADAAVVSKIWAGPGVWSGLPRGTPFGGLANTADGAGVPFPLPDNWIRYFLLKDPAADTSTLGYADWYRLFAQSQREYASTIDTSNPNLTAFRATGGKLLTWHGEADEVIFPAGTTQYWNRVEHATPGKNSDFYRLFMAPGVGHCGGGTGPLPTDPLAALVAWVEEGKAPETLPAANTTSTRNLCQYPLVNHYDGKGNPKEATSYRCTHTY